MSLPGADLRLGEVFADPEVVRLYGLRPPYPDAVFAILRGLLVGPRVVLDAGAGAGALARGLVSAVERVDAVEPSAGMVAEGRRRTGDEPRIHWIVARAEDAALQPPYGLITCGASLHWMDLDVVLPRFRDALAPGARLAIVDTVNVHGPYPGDALAVIRKYSEVQDHRETEELVAELASSGRFVLEGEEHTDAMPFEQSIDEFIEHLHSTSTLARVRLGDRAESFDADLRAVLARHGVEPLRYGVRGYVAWGRPRLDAA